MLFCSIRLFAQQPGKMDLNLNKSVIITKMYLSTKLLYQTCATIAPMTMRKIRN